MASDYGYDGNPPRYDLQRDPACSNCGTVDPAPAYQPRGFRHRCNPAQIHLRTLGVEAVVKIAEACRDMFAAFRR